MTFLSCRLKIARKSAGLNIEDAHYLLRSSGITFTRQTLYNYEDGVSFPNARDLGIMAAVYQQPIDFFYSNKSQKKLCVSRETSDPDYAKDIT